MSYKGPWASLKKAAPESPEDFMVYLWSVVPELDVMDLIRVRRSERSSAWVQEVCDFIWICMQTDREKWKPEMDRLWPSIVATMEEQNMDEAFAQLSF
tara:strand:+ start:1010 stop:1303 length:294 start_codon:yes stop_codon:yes gene_type:complete